MSNSTLSRPTNEEPEIKTSKELGIIVLFVLFLFAMMVFCHTLYREKRQVGVTNSPSPPPPPISIEVRQENNKESLEINQISLNV